MRIGTRGSALARWQSEWVADRLRASHPGVSVELVEIRTRGDRDRNSRNRKRMQRLLASTRDFCERRERLHAESLELQRARRRRLAEELDWMRTVLDGQRDRLRSSRREKEQERLAARELRRPHDLEAVAHVLRERLEHESGVVAELGHGTSPELSTWLGATLDVDVTVYVSVCT